MSRTTLANKAGKILFTVSKENNCLETVSNELNIVTETLLSDKKFITLMNNPNINKNIKLDLLNNVLINCNTYLLNTIKILVENLQIINLKEVKEVFLNMYNNFEKIVVVSVESTYKLNNNQLLKLEENLKTKLNAKSIKIKNVVDETLIGGLKISYNGKVIDATVKKQLLDIKNRLSVI